MKVSSTPEGGLRIDAGGPADWAVLRCIARDAGGRPRDLAARLGALVEDRQHPGDWEEFVVPELRATFDGQLETIAAAVEEAARRCHGQAGPLHIARDQGEAWYGALNQARLALEEEHRFGPHPAPDPADAARRAALFRAQFYLAIQALLLERVIPRP